MQSISRALRSRNYRLFFTGQAISLTGNWMTQTATIWLVYHLTHSAWMLGVVGFASQLPNFLLTPIAGVLVDRWNRHRTILLTQFLAMLQSLALAFLAFTNQIDAWQVMALSVFQGAVNALDMPARQAFVVQMVDRKEDVSNAIALNSSIFSGARLVGPAIAGIVIASLGAGTCFLLDGLSYLAVLAGLLAMKLPPLARDSSAQSTGTLWQNLQEGFQYAFGFPPMRAILSLVALTSLVGMPYLVLVPIFAVQIFHGGATTLGLMMAATGFGALIAAVYLSSRSSVLGLGKLIAIAPTILGVALMTFALSRILWLSLLAMFFLGMGLMLQRTSSNTLLQTIVEEDKRGRVMSFFLMAFTGMATCGNLLAGGLAQQIGAPHTLFIGGVLSVIGSLLFIRQFPTFRKQIRPIYYQIGILPQTNS
ncbi:MAG: MFS transporter [Leptodesmis sp.]|uniref:MFS transporter n=1 Tax=Leptodesmis sp. TaxID=3100501 RepID=UPI003D0AF6F2